MLVFLLYAYVHVHVHRHTHTHTHTHTQFPEHPYGDLTEKLLLYRHCSDNSLKPLKENEPIEDGVIIEVILQGRHIMYPI